jgi:hypothetical protein
MVLKRHEDKPWEWKDNECFTNRIPNTSVEAVDCDGVMELKDVNLKGRRCKKSEYTPLGPGAPVPFKFHLEKIWVCNKCGHVFVE